MGNKLTNKQTNTTAKRAKSLAGPVAAEGHQRAKLARARAQGPRAAKGKRKDKTKLPGKRVAKAKLAPRAMKAKATAKKAKGKAKAKAAPRGSGMEPDFSEYVLKGNNPLERTFASARGLNHEANELMWGGRAEVQQRWADFHRYSAGKVVFKDTFAGAGTGHIAFEALTKSTEERYGTRFTWEVIACDAHPGVVEVLRQDPHVDTVMGSILGVLPEADREFLTEPEIVKATVRLTDLREQVGALLSESSSDSDADSDSSSDSSSSSSSSSCLPELGDAEVLGPEEAGAEPLEELPAEPPAVPVAEPLAEPRAEPPAVAAAAPPAVAAAEPRAEPPPVAAAALPAVAAAEPPAVPVLPLAKPPAEGKAEFDQLCIFAEKGYQKERALKACQTLVGVAAPYNFKKAIGDVKKGWSLGSGRAKPKLELDTLASMLVEGTDSVEVTCSRGKDLRKLGSRLFEVPEGHQFPSTEVEVQMLVDKGVSVTGLKVTPLETSMCLKTGLVKPWHVAAMQPEKRDHVIVECAGSPCWDYSCEGNQLRLEGPTVPVFLAWAFSVLFLLPDLVLHENVVAFPAALLHLLFGCFYFIHTEVVSPPDISTFGVLRRRQWTLLKRKGFAALTQPVFTLLQAHRLHIGEDEILKEIDFFVAEIQKENPNHFQLTARAKSALRLLVPSNPGRVVFPLECSVERASCTASGFLGALKRNSTRRYNVALKRWLLPGEKLLAHGLPVIQWAADALGVELRPGLGSAPTATQNMLAGNGMHIMVVFAFLNFGISSGSPRLSSP